MNVIHVHVIIAALQPLLDEGNMMSGMIQLD
jgi:hypothetical protein